ncbi:STM4014 family protein [Actinoplanes sp. TRM 88003]|uniref:STM4014 family protein n=1 Tax=Paractinoplanes aksuensis TaxID=2939490 RepID=A0ABT1DN58_9ACTN|nr:STM4014 family protein [Actinoplanes aksuensis]MCO8272259.1 STM4014 family protein [Actinoplanes aksuensis]
MTRLAVVGNPQNRRVGLFAAAVARAGRAAPAVYPWRSVLTGGPVPGPGETVRIDSPGEDAEVDRLLRGAAMVVAPGEIDGGAAAYAGLGVALDRIAAGGGHLLNPPGDILTMSDKRRCHALLHAAGIPVPPALPEVDGYAALRAAMRASGWSRVFVKPAHGSSASGVLALAVAGARIQATTSVELGDDGRLYNNLRVRRYDDEATIACIVDRLGPDGLHVERWYPKAGLGDRVLDLRVLVIAGEPSHVVVRASRTPLTNLHLGNVRGDVAAVRAAAGPVGWAEAMATCAAVARCFPGSLHVGVDLMFRAGWRGHAVAEVNAFGDLLVGHDTYDAEVAALDRREAACVS